MNAKTPSKRGADFEVRARQFLSKAMGMGFSKKDLLIGPPNRQIRHAFDLVYHDPSGGYTIGEIKDYEWRRGFYFPNGKLDQVKDDLGRLQLARVLADRRLLILRESTSLHGKSLVDAFIKRLKDRRLLDGIEVWAYTQGSALEGDSAIQVHGPRTGLTLRLTDSS